MSRLTWAFGLLVATACSPIAEEAADGPVTAPIPASTAPSPTTTLPEGYPPATAAPEGPLDPVAEAGLEALLAQPFSSGFDPSPAREVSAGGDVRAAWLLADLLRFYQAGPARDELVAAFGELTGLEPRPGGSVVDFVWAFDHLIAWDLPAWDGYPEMKRVLFTRIDPGWEPFFQEDLGVDWRWVTWGGVRSDDRPLGDNGPCVCIPSLDYPGTTDADGGSWYPDDRVVFGVVVDGEALALPRHQMEVHEMVNLTLGGRELGIPYCTLCGAAQAFYVDDVPGVDRVVLRTSGLLSRSNKVMYDLETGSMFDTFTGRALTGPLGRDGVVLEQASVVASTWGDWKRAHPETRILAEDGGIGHFYPEDPLGDRDAFGPIFPVGQVDPRLPAQESVVGVITADGTPVAFPVAAAREALAAGGKIEFSGLTVRLTDSLRVFDAAGDELSSHQSFWFAWSQFHPGTTLWEPLDLDS